jgi:ABC-type multidrug transport system fused ATPase/permease subunit
VQLALRYIIQTLNDPLMEDDEKKSLMVVYSLLWVVPYAMVHYLAYRKCFWKVGGSLKKYISTLLLKKFLNYTDGSRNEVAIETLLMAMIRDVTEATGDGYVAFVDLFTAALMKVVYLILAMIYLQTKDGGEINLVPLLLILSMPVFIGAFLIYRQEITFSLKAKFFKADNATIGHAIKSVVNYPLIADYDRRTFQLQRYEALYNGSNGAGAQFASSSVNSSVFAPWLTYIFVAVWITYGGMQVVDGTTTLALFLSTISIFRGIGGEVGTISEWIYT